MLTCYDVLTARMLARCGVDYLLIGDSAANVVLGHRHTLPVTQDFLDELCRGVRRGHPEACLVLDMAFGSYHGPDAVNRICQSVKQTTADAVKLEVTAAHLPLIEQLAAAGVAVIGHVGLTPQSVQRFGHRYAGRTAAEAIDLLKLCQALETAGAAGLLLEAVTPEATATIQEHVTCPVIGCGAGPGCESYVVVTPDLLGLTDGPPRFVPQLDAVGEGVLAQTESIIRAYQQAVATAAYPAAEHVYPMLEGEAEQLARQLRTFGMF